jgi:hypothetical protein
MWLLLIMLSVGPFSGQYNGENDVWLHIQMRSQTECMMAAQNITTTARIFQDLNPNLKVKAICRPDELNQTYESNNITNEQLFCRINYRQCLDLVNEN